MPSLSETRFGSRGPSFPSCRPKPPVRVFRTPLLGFIKDRPSADASAACPLPGGPKAALRHEDANLRACSAPAVPPGSDGFLHAGPAGLLHPATGHEVRHISSSLLGPSPKKEPPHRAFPNGAYTLRSFSLRDSRSASPRPFPSRCSSSSSAPLPRRASTTVSLRFQGALSLRALLHRKVRCVSRCCHRNLLDAPLGLAPSGVMNGAQLRVPEGSQRLGARCRSEDRG